MQTFLDTRPSYTLAIFLRLFQNFQKYYFSRISSAFLVAVNFMVFIFLHALHTDLGIPYINEVITTAARKSRDRNLNHHNPLIANLYNRPLGNRLLQRYWPEDLIE